jgi:hypothetical protein
MREGSVDSSQLAGTEILHNRMCEIGSRGVESFSRRKLNLAPAPCWGRHGGLALHRVPDAPGGRGWLPRWRSTVAAAFDHQFIRSSGEGVAEKVDALKGPPRIEDVRSMARQLALCRVTIRVVVVQRSLPTSRYDHLVKSLPPSAGDHWSPAATNTTSVLSVSVHFSRHACDNNAGAAFALSNAERTRM